MAGASAARDLPSTRAGGQDDVSSQANSLKLRSADLVRVPLGLMDREDLTPQLPFMQCSHQFTAILNAQSGS